MDQVLCEAEIELDDVRSGRRNFQICLVDGRSDWTLGSLGGGDFDETVNRIELDDIVVM